MIRAATREGLSRAWTMRSLVAGVWLIHLAVAAAAAFPLWRVARGVLGPLPGADVLREGVRIGVLADLLELRPGLVGSVGLVGLAVAGFGLLLGAAVSGGILESLRGGGGDDRPRAHRFGRGAGRFFGRFVRLDLAVGALFGVVGLLGVLPFVKLTVAYLREGTGAGPVGPLGALLVAGLIVVVASLVLDAARIHIVRSDHGALAGLRAGMRTVLRHPLAWLGVWAVNAALLGVVLAAYLLVRGAVPTDTWPLIFTMVALQQAFTLTRTGLRVALVASEMALVEGRATAVGRPQGAQPESDSSSSAG